MDDFINRIGTKIKWEDINWEDIIIKNNLFYSGWIDNGDNLECPDCHTQFDVSRNVTSEFYFCPACGACMRWKE